MPGSDPTPAPPSVDPASVARKLARRAAMLRHVRPFQLVWRLRRLVRRRLPGALRVPRPPSSVPDRATDRAEDLLRALEYTCPAGSALERADRVLAGRFEFVGWQERFDGTPFRPTPRAPRLWHFQLHYFDYAVDLARAYAGTGETSYRRKLESLWSDWIEANPAEQGGDAWHPYPTSLRIVSWIRAGLILERADARNAFPDPVLASLHRQARLVRSDPEHDVPGNHLVKNARALLFAGRFFLGTEAEDWLEHGLRLLRDAVREQVLPDGGHFERSPYYHAQVLADLLDALPLLHGDARDAVTAAVRAMARWLRAVRHPDGTLPLYNDGMLRGEAAADRLLEGAAALAGTGGMGGADGGGAGEGDATPVVECLPESGYYLFRPDLDQLLVVDCGPPAPDHLPAHVHCDLLSIEWSLAGSRVLTNAGTYTYEPGPERDATRSTASHNTVRLAGEEQSDVWNSFRCGRRARALDAVVLPGDGRAYFSGSYRGFGGNRIRHRREILRQAGVWLVVDSLGSSKAERLSVTARYRLAPEVRVEASANGLVRASVGETPIWLRALGGAGWRVERGWFAPEIGTRVPCTVLCLDGRGSDGVRIGCLLGGPEPAAAVRHEHGFGPEEVPDAGWSVRIRRGSEAVEMVRPEARPDLRGP